MYRKKFKDSGMLSNGVFVFCLVLRYTDLNLRCFVHFPTSVVIPTPTTVITCEHTGPPLSVIGGDAMMSATWAAPRAYGAPVRAILVDAAKLKTPATASLLLGTAWHRNHCTLLADAAECCISRLSIFRAVMTTGSGMCGCNGGVVELVD